MLSRANSDAGTRLRRAKSSSSVSHRSQGVPIPVVDPRHAEWAAVEAYRRAHEHQDSVQQARQPVKQTKRQSRASQKSEGSHFEESRNGNRIGTARPKELSRTSSLKRSDSTAKVLTQLPSADFEGTIVTRPRRVVNTIGTTQPKVGSQVTNQTTTTGSDRVRKAKSAYYESTSNTEDDTFQLKKTRRATYYPDTPYRTAIESRDSASGDLTAPPTAESRKPTAREMQTDDSIKVAAWDAYLQDFHQRKLNVRKSFIAPLKKILTKEHTPAAEVNFDHSTPPYNFALESDDVFSPSPIPPVAITESFQLPKPRKTRTVSDSLKSKFHRLMSKSKRTPSSMPAQHIESQNLHFDPSAFSGNEWPLGSQYKLPPPPPVPAPSSLVGNRQSSSGSSQSGGDAATTKSRVTSWTNSTSTGTGTNRISHQAPYLCPIDESGMISPAKEQLSVSSKPGQGSFFGRALRMPLRRHSKADLGRSSEDSQRLYDALCKQMQGSESGISNTIDTSINDDVIATETVVKEYLPPRCDVATDDQSMASGALPGQTIRAIRPDSPEAPNPEAQTNSVVQGHAKKLARKSSWFNNARRSLPSQNIPRLPSQNMFRWPSQNVPKDEPEPVTKAVRPSQEQIASRLDKSQKRWQSPLNDESPVQSRALRYDEQEDNPYKLRSISSTAQVDYLPVAVHHGGSELGVNTAQAPRTVFPVSSEREQVISPSVYSRASECRSTTPNDVLGDHGTFITVTGREVKRYSLDSPAKSIRENFVAKPSHEWKAWLNTELRDFSATPGADELRLDDQGGLAPELCSTPDVVPTTSSHIRQPVESFNRGEVPSDSREDLSSGPPINFSKTRRPKLEPRSSSIMNERYPLVGTGRSSSNEHAQYAGSRPEPTGRRSSSGSKALSAVKQPSDSAILAIERDTDVETPLASNNINSGRPRIRERHSAAILGATRRKTNPVAPGMSLSSDAKVPISTKPKSARRSSAVYRNTNSPGPSSINIRRKPMAAVLQDDETLRKISEGPYGRAASANKENNVPPAESSMSAAGKLA